MSNRKMKFWFNVAVVVWMLVLSILLAGLAR